MKMILVLVLLSFSCTAFAEEEEAKESSIRFIALGERLPLIQKLPKFERLPRFRPEQWPYEFPPTPVIVSDSVELREEVPILLRRISPPVRFDAGAKSLKLWEKKKVVEGPWLELKPLKSPQNLGVLFLEKPEVETTWEKPKMLVVDDSAGAFPAGAIRFVNATDKVMIIKLGGEKPFGLASGKIKCQVIEGGEGPLLIGYRGSDGAAKMIWENTVKLAEGERIQGFFYQPRDTSSGAVKFLHLKERHGN